jgi:hypothetical protein
VARVLARVRVEAFLRFEDMSPRRPRVRSAARNLIVPEVAGGGASVLGGLVELGRDRVVKLRNLFEALAHRLAS